MIVVFNGDVLTQVDLGGLIELHRTPRRSRDLRFNAAITNGVRLVERTPTATSCVFSKSRRPRNYVQTINAGIYVLEPIHSTNSAERRLVDREQLFPSFIERGEDVSGVDLS